MAAPVTPGTPVTPAAQKIHQPTPTGAWQHPRLNEITRRQYATTFDERNIRAILFNGAFLIASFVIPENIGRVALLRILTSPLTDFINSIPYSNWVPLLLRLLFVINICQQFWPLVRRYYPDDLADIPLTPSQRKAMGLDPNVSTPQTPGSVFASPQYITPPRYQKSTPRSSFSNQADRSMSGSPLSGSPRPNISNSPFPPSSGSPLFQKALGGGSATRRLSYGGSPLSSSLFAESSSSNPPGTPTPSTGRASVGLNNKWLYEKRRDSPRSNIFS